MQTSNSKIGHWSIAAQPGLAKRQMRLPALRAHSGGTAVAPASRSMASGSAWTFAGLSSDYVAGFILTFVLAQELGPGGYGQLALVFAVCDVPRMLISSALGTSAAVNIAQRRGAGLEPSGLMNGAAALFAAAAAISLLLLAGTGGFIADVLNQPQLANEYRLAGLVVLSACCLYYASSVFQAWQRIDRFGQSHIVASLLRLAATVLFLSVMGWGVRGGIAGAAVGLGVTAVIMVSLARTERPLLYRNAAIEWRPIVRYSLPLTVSWLAFFAYTRVDLLILGLFTKDQAELGYFAFAAAVSVVPYIGAQSLVASVGPQVAKKTGQEDSEAVRRLFLRSVSLVVVVALPVALAMALLIRPATEAVLPKYLPGAALVAVFAVAIVPRSLGTLCAGGFLTPAGFARTVARITALAAIANVALDFALIPAFGAMGSVVGSVCVQTATGIVGAFLVFRLYNVKAAALKSSALWSFALACLMATSIELCLHMPIDSLLIRLVVAVSIGAAVLGGTVLTYWRRTSIPRGA